MPVFRYKGRDKATHKLINDTIEAANQTEAVKKLRGKGILVLSVTADRSITIKWSPLNRVGPKDRILFARQLAVMIKAGLPILQALKAIKDQTTNKTLGDTVKGLIKEVEGGTSLSEAFSHYPNVFPPIFISVTKIGEKSGKLEEVLNRLASQLEKDDELLSKIKGAMIYPAFVLVALVVVMILIMVYIVPQLKSIFEDSNVELPIITQVMLKISNFMSHYIGWILGAAVILFILVKIAARQQSVRLFLEKVRFVVPVFGQLYRQVLMTRFTNTLATLLAAGLPMIEAIKTTAEVMNSPTFSEALSDITHQIEDGGSLSHLLLADKHFPSMIGHMVAIGEDSGNIDSVLETVAGFYDKDVENLTRNLSASLEPLLMLAMGLGVGLVVASVIVPIYGLVNAV